MRIQLEGSEKHIKQLVKELIPRCKRDKVKLEIVEDIEMITIKKKEEINQIIEVSKPELKEVKKRGPKAKK